MSYFTWGSDDPDTSSGPAPPPPSDPTESVGSPSGGGGRYETWDFSADTAGPPTNEPPPDPTENLSSVTSDDTTKKRPASYDPTASVGASYVPTWDDAIGPSSAPIEAPPPS